MRRERQWGGGSGVKGRKDRERCEMSEIKSDGRSRARGMTSFGGDLILFGVFVAMNRVLRVPVLSAN